MCWTSARSLTPGRCGEWSQGSSGNWTFNPTEGYVNVAVSKGEFTLTVP